jgi:WD40 repeat protein
VKLWDTASFQQLLTLESEGSEYDHVYFSPDGNVLAAGNRWGLVRLWRAPSWEEIAAAEKAKQP